MNVLLMKQPSAWIPMAMSLAALLLVPIHVAQHGFAHEADEGAAARLFQLLIVAEVPIVVYFALKWLPRAPRPAFIVLALQAGAVCLALATVRWLEAHS